MKESGAALSVINPVGSVHCKGTFLPVQAYLHFPYVWSGSCCRRIELISSGFRQVLDSGPYHAELRFTVTQASILLAFSSGGNLLLN